MSRHLLWAGVTAVDQGFSDAADRRPADIEAAPPRVAPLREIGLRSEVPFLATHYATFGGHVWGPRRVPILAASAQHHDLGPDTAGSPTWSPIVGPYVFSAGVPWPD